ncbi:hypothetical protein MNBD_BACTEROID01-2517 [hydrothermal vent metagenome]|uniref:Carbohydrate-binding domain-containing protein n=1 Tax=hydrothermal vent metagenome TaxID=652676 RepID=A0A3B0TX69_9ZZZZ
MKKIVAKEIKPNKPANIKEAGHLLESQTISHPINILNWKEFDYQPKVAFRIGHTDNEVWLKYYVSEKYIRAMEEKTNGDVYKDSCVEFFISLDKENYYNFEFNCIGTKHVAYGPGRHERELVSPEILEAIKTDSSLGSLPFEEKAGQHNWEMTIIIPLSCFAYSNLKSLKGLKATANFYKCGDETSEPHYVTWNPVGTEHPDYHRPEFFGGLYFE